MYQKKKYDPRACEICGKIFVPKRLNIVTCADPECKRRSKLDKQNRWYRENYTRIREEKQKQKDADAEYVKVDEPHVPKPDTIVAIGYAERQMQQSLAKAGKIKVTL